MLYWFRIWIPFLVLIIVLAPFVIIVMAIACRDTDVSQQGLLYRAQEDEDATVLTQQGG